MSDTEQPSEGAVLKQLRDVVISLHRAGNTDDLTVKRVRARTEEALGLEAGFLNNSDWKQKSKDAIVEAVVSGDNRSFNNIANSRRTNTASKSQNLSLRQRSRSQRRSSKRLQRLPKTSQARNAKLQHRRSRPKSEGRPRHPRMTCQTSRPMQRANPLGNQLERRRMW